MMWGMFGLAALGVIGAAGRPEGGVELLRQAQVASSWSLDGPLAPLEVFEDQAVGSALRLRPRRSAEVTQTWHLGIGQVLTQEVEQGELIHLSMMARSPQGLDPWVVFEQSSPPHEKILNRRIVLGPEWKEVSLVIPVTRSYAPGESQFKLFVGTMEGEVEIARLQLTLYPRGTSTALFQTTISDYDERPTEEWMREAQERIERIRKGDMEIVVLDRQGRPVEGATVRVVQQRHAFRFGTCVPAARIVEESPDGVLFRQHLKDSGFNTVTFENDLKWPQMYETGGYFSFDRTTQAREWLVRHGFDIRGHTIAWGSYRWLPAGFDQLTPEEARRRLRQRLEDVARRTEGWVYVWDVVNEAVTEVELWDKLGWDDFVGMYRQAGELMPGVKLAYNDFNISNSVAPHRQAAIARARLILDAGAPLHIFGDQAHHDPPGPCVMQSFDAWDEVHRGTGLPIEITEFDFASHDDQAQAEYTVDFMTAAFSHPAMEGFIFWGFWERSHWKARQGAHKVLADWTPRPSWTEAVRLITDEWWTREQVQTGRDGVARTRAFFGKHELTIWAGAEIVRRFVELERGQDGRVVVRL